MLPPLLDISREELTRWCAERGHSSFRVDQIRRWIFGKRVTDFADMHDIPATLRKQLSESFRFFAGEIVRHQVARDRTEKLLIRLHDGEHVECVLMREAERNTICVSSQVGCGMGCVFCASGLLGVKRNLSVGEILEQIIRVDRLLGPEERLTNLVAMGIGEPLANLANLLPALATLNDKGGMGIGARRITISTVGLPEKIRELAQCGKSYNLAVSLHAPNDELRTQLVPVNRNIGIQKVLEAADEFFEISGRRVTYEYVLIGNVNDAPEHASQLAGLLRGRCAHVNVIPMNGVSELPFHDPSTPRTERFVNLLEKAGVKVTIRKRKGADIDAACGQLRLAEEKLHVLS